MDPHPYPEDTHTCSHGYGYGHGLRKVDLGYDPPWVIPVGISLDDTDELGRKMAIPGDHHKCQGWCQMDGAMSSACCDLKQSRNGAGDPKGDQEAMGHIECDWSGANNVEGAGYDGRWCRMDGTMSGARCDPKRS